MTDIIGELDWRKKGDTHVQLLSPIEYQLDCGRIVIAERGFRYDGGSVPSAFRSIVCPFGSAADHGFCLHDRLYHGHRDLQEQQFTRLQADSAMLEIFLYCGVPNHIAYGVYTGVLAGGLAAWQTEAEKIQWDMHEDKTFLDQ